MTRRNLPAGRGLAGRRPPGRRSPAASSLLWLFLAGVGHVLAGPQSVSRQAADDPALDRLREFIAWAHPSEGDCVVPQPPVIVERWEGGLRADYDLVCGARKQQLGALLSIREGASVWQVVQGFEAPRHLLDLPPAPGAPALAPPGSEGQGAGRSAPTLRGVEPPRAVVQVRPDYPEEASRARLFGEARVQLLVEVSDQGRPERARPLRGPDPDLGMHAAATAAVLRWSFLPARFAGGAVRYFAPIEITFKGLPPESRSWIYRALFRVDAIVSPDQAAVDAARRRLDAGVAFDRIASEPSGARVGAGDWGFVPAATMAAPIRKALHDAPVGGIAGPVTAEGLTYLMRKRGEIYYTIRSPEGEDLSYEIVHQVGAPEGEALRKMVQDDIRDYLAESRRSAYMNEAARLMGISQKRTESGQLRIFTDVLDDDETRMVARVVETTIAAHRQFWGPLVPLRPLTQPILVYAFARTSDHDRLHAIWQSGKAAGATVAGFAPAGEYIPSSRILAIPCEAMGGHLPVPILIHEVIHMLDYETVYGAGVTPSTWFEEGLATYFGFSQIDSQLRIEPGDIRRSGTIISGTVRVQFDPRSPLRDYRRRVRGGELVSLRALLGASPSDPLWGGQSASNAYGAAWTLVHFLKDGQRARRRPGFEALARLEARGEGGRAAFETLFGPDLDTLEALWREDEDGL